jgi:DNA polymerase-3 subunit gamma/tau
MDVMEIDGASNRGIDRIRELREGIVFAPARDRFKIYIIDEVHMLTTEAFNALLKTLEEPPRHVFFIFATTEIHKVPATIRSRCQRFDFRRIPASLIQAKLKEIADAEGIAIDQESLKIICRESEGSLRDAQSLLDQIISYAGKEITPVLAMEVMGTPSRKWMMEIVHHCLDSDINKALGILTEADERGINPRQFAAEISDFISGCIKLKLLDVHDPQSHAESIEIPFTDQEKKDISEILGNHGVEELIRMLRIIVETADHVSQTRLPKITIEIALMKMCMISKIIPAQEILSKLQVMEKAARVKAREEDSPQRTIQPIPMISRQPAPASQTMRSERMPSPVEKKTDQPETPVAAEEKKIVTQEREVAEKNYSNLMTWMEKEKTPIASLLMKAKFIDDTGSEIKIEMDSSEEGIYFQKRILENIDEIRAILKNFYKQNKNLTVSLRQNNPSFREKKQKTSSELMKERERRLLNHPVVKEAQETFGGTLTDIKICE